MKAQRLVTHSFVAIGLTVSLGLAIPASAEVVRVSGAPTSNGSQQMMSTPRVYSPDAAANTRMRTFAAPVRNTSAIDKQITNRVIAVLGADAYLRGQVEVATLDGIVTLVGRVDSPAMASRAVQIANNVDGVRSVDEASLRVG